MIGDYFYTFRRWVKREIWLRLRRTVGVVHGLPLVSSLLVCLILALSGQMHELYRASIEGAIDAPALMRLASGGFAVTLLSAALYFANYTLSKTRIDVLYSAHASPPNDRVLRGLRNAVGLLVAAGPWGGLLIGIRTAAARQRVHSDRMTEAVAELDIARFDTSGWMLVADRLDALFLATAILAAVTLVVLHVLRRHEFFQNAVLLLVACSIAGLVLLPTLLWLEGGSGPALSWPTAIGFYRTIGPLALVAVTFAAAIAAAVTFALLSSHTGVPLVLPALVVIILAIALEAPLTVVLWAIIALTLTFALLGAASERYEIAVLGALIALLLAPGVAHTVALTGAKPGASVNTASHQPADPVEVRIREWLASRQHLMPSTDEADRTPYPVFIVAAQGGGIYAAASAALFLSRLEDHCHGFSSHVFAISGVSGGAVGSAIYNGLVPEAAPSRGCGERPVERGAMVDRAAAIVSADHLSPLLGVTLSSVAGLVGDRTVALEQSFVVAERQSVGSSRLSQPFEQHWQPRGSAAALVLNATWAETGERVAFAPFRLEGQRDGTLFAFGDRRLKAQSREAVSTIRAAMVSARFPGVMPAYALVSGERRLTFVDGGYADASGAATALELFHAMRRIIETEKLSVDLRLVLLTSAHPQPQSQPQAPGQREAAGRETLAPLFTLLNVRERLSTRAITRAIVELGGLDDLDVPRHAARRGARDGWKTAVIELDHENFELALGWTISRTTLDLVSRMIADEGACTSRPVADNPRRAEIDTNFGISAQRVRGNGCVQRALLELVRAQTR